jgi:hypothetical protein
VSPFIREVFGRADESAGDFEPVGDGLGKRLFTHSLDPRARRPLVQCCPEARHGSVSAGGADLNGTVGKISDRALDSEANGKGSGPPPEPDPLYVTLNDKDPRERSHLSETVPGGRIVRGSRHAR